MSEEDCRFMFHAAKGDPSWYVGSCEGNKCHRTKVKCLLDALKADSGFAAEWGPGDPVPAHCELRYGLCRLHSRLSLEVMINHEAFLDPAGPVIHPAWLRGRTGLTANQAAGGSPAQTADLYLAELREAAARGAGGDALADMAMTFAQRPEIAAALYNAAPAVFSGLFQPAETAEVFAPTLARRGGVVLDPADLNDAGRAALAELRRSLAAAPADMRDSMFGSIAVGP